jgi:hypothetical protein
MASLPDETKGEKKKILTSYYPHIVEENRATNTFEFLRDCTPWEAGIRSSKTKKETRKAYSIPFREDGTLADPDSHIDRTLLDLVRECRDRFEVRQGVRYSVLDIYANYYRDGDDWAPSHSHPYIQLVISLGATRKLKVGSKVYQMNNGDGILFGKSSHSLLQEFDVKEGRISIAAFMCPL